MQKDEFIKKVLFHFRDYFADEAEKKHWMDDYRLAISNYVDYDKLYLVFLNNYKNATKRPPLPSWFAEHYKSCFTDNTIPYEPRQICINSAPPESYYKQKAVWVQKWEELNGRKWQGIKEEERRRQERWRRYPDDMSQPTSIGELSADIWQAPQATEL